MTDDLLSEDTDLPQAESVEVKMTKPPDKKKHEAALSELMTSIEAKQAEMRTLPGKADDTVVEVLRSLRSEKESTIVRRRRTDDNLSALNAEIRKKNNELTKVQSGMQGYRNESKINETLQRLEYQLKMNNFKLSEEKKIVSEIDALKRSKKVLNVVTSLKKEVDSMRDNQRSMRSERDLYFKKVTELKQREDGIKRKVQSDEIRKAEIKKEIDALFEEKRALIGQFKAQEKDFYKYRDSVRLKQKQEIHMKKQEKRIAYEKELAEYEASREPYEDEKLLCSTLIAYLHKCLPITTPEMTSHEHEESERGSSGHDSDSLSQSLESEGLYLLKKKQEDLFSGTIKPKTQRRSKKDKKRILMQNKPLHHSPQTLNQFAELRIKAPTTVQDVAEAIKQVESKKIYYEQLPPLIIPPHGGAAVGITCCDGLPSDGASSVGGGAPSITESAIAESIPSTPEVQTDTGDAACNPFLRDGDRSSPWRHQRKLSHDSGAYELEEDSEESNRTPDICGYQISHPFEKSMEISTEESSKMAASGDFSLPCRALSTVSSMSDKDSSASSDTIVDSPHNKSGDDLKMVPNLAQPMTMQDASNSSRDLMLDVEWPVLSRENSQNNSPHTIDTKPSLECSNSNSGADIVSKVASDFCDLKTAGPESEEKKTSVAQSSFEQTDSSALNIKSNVDSILDKSEQRSAGDFSQKSFHVIGPFNQSTDSIGDTPTYVPDLGSHATLESSQGQQDAIS